MMETVLQVLERDPVPPHEIVPGVPRELETICLKCLEKMPEDRYPTAQELADDLERYPPGRRRRGNRRLSGSSAAGPAASPRSSLASADWRSWPC